MERAGVWIQRAGAFTLGGLVLAAPLAVGGTRDEIRLIGALLALLTAAALIAGRGERRLRFALPLWGPVLLVGWGLMQLVPLPQWLLGWLSPEALEVRRYSLEHIGRFAGAHPISLDPRGTWIGVAHQAAFAALAVGAINLKRGHRQALTWALIASGALIAFIGFAHWGLEINRILGLYAPKDIAHLGGYFSTFVNNNTLAGFLSLGTLTALGVFAQSSHPLEQRLAFLAAGICGAGVFFSGSRGGQVALVIGLIIWALLAHSKGRRPADSQRERARLTAKLALVSVVLGLGLSLALLPDWHSLVTQPGPDPKIASWDAAWVYAKRYWLVGSGRGTFEYIYPQFQTALLSNTVTHPENIILQLWCEWGVFGALIGLGAGVWGVYALVRCAGRATAPLHWAHIAGLTAVGLQQLVDFGLESAGLAYPTAMVLGLAFSHCQPCCRPRLRGALIPIALLFVLFAARAPALLGGDPDGAGGAPEERVAAHPADYLTPLRIGAAEGPMSIQERLRWLNRSMALFPQGHRAHLQAARLLAGKGLLQQAALEYRLTLERAPWRELELLEEIVAALPDRAALAKAIPTRPRARWRLGNVLLAEHRARDARALMEGFMETHALYDEPIPPRLYRIRARACRALGDLPCVEASAHWLVEHGERSIGHALQALSALRRGDRAQARQAIVSSAVEGRSDPDYQRVTAEVYEALGELDKARAALDRLWLLHSAWPQRAGRALALRGRMERRAGDRLTALKIFREALAIDPRPRYALALVEIHRELGRDGDAEAELKRLRARWPHVVVEDKRDDREER